VSRIGRLPIQLPSGVEVKVEGRVATVKGPKGTLTQELPPRVNVQQENGTLKVVRQDDERESRASHGLARALLANMVEGVTKGFQKALEIQGVGYRAQLQGSDLLLSLGYSHPVSFRAPEGITFEVPSPTRIVVSGIDKQLVGQVAADIRNLRKPDPYKGKGIRYAGEQVRRKAGKSGK